MFIRDGLLDQLGPLRPALRGKLVIDITNPFNSDYSDFILPWDTSGAEQIEANPGGAQISESILNSNPGWNG
jgi:8-hydroxy-5-deazaflavin:NADPH oxidoreductase